MRQQGAQQPVSVCMCVVWGDGRNDFMLCVSVYVPIRVELSLRDAGRVTGPFSSASTFRRGSDVQILD